jgi:Cu2+-exporting ATPase
MIHTYDISGMSCDDCRLKVIKALNTIDDIEVSVTLNPPVAKITMERHILTKVFQRALTAIGNYKISMGNL